MTSVLYVEDEPVNVLVMRGLFGRRPDLELRVASNGAQALDDARQTPPALLLVDIGLPDIDGRRLLAMLRRVPGCAAVPAVAVTADATVSLAETSFDDLWPKPLDFGSVLDRLEYLLPQPATTAGG